jgi:hypothetical protein
VDGARVSINAAARAWYSLANCLSSAAAGGLVVAEARVRHRRANSIKSSYDTERARILRKTECTKPRAPHIVPGCDERAVTVRQFFRSKVGHRTAFPGYHYRAGPTVRFRLGPFTEPSLDIPQ